MCTRLVLLLAFDEVNCNLHSLKFSLKPGSHRKIAKDYRPKPGKDQEILSESGCNPLKIVLKLQISNDF